MRLARLAAAVALLALAACAPKLIPNTQIRDTETNRAILELMREYKLAFEAQDAKAIAGLASPRYLDARESISYATLTDELQKTFDKLKQVQLDVTVRRIDTKGERAQVDYFYSTSFQLETEAAEWKTESDEKRMLLERVDGKWKVLSGF